MARSNRANREVRVGRKERREKPQREFVEKFAAERESRVVTVVPKNEAQGWFLEALRDEKVVIGMGCAGTGKTFMAATHAANMYLKNPNFKLYLSRPYVTMGNSVGLLPGEIEEKMAQFLAPLTSVLKKQLGSKYEADVGRNIQIQLIESIRGLDLQDGILIVDEAQNLTIEEVKSVVTRIGENAQIILIGDNAQTDLHEEDSGLPWLIDLVERHDLKGFDWVQFGIDDIVRSGMVKDFIIALEKEYAEGRR